MQIYIFNGELETLNQLKEIIMNNFKCEIHCIDNSKMLKQAMEENSPDILFFDAEIKNALSMVESIRNSEKRTKVILVANSGAYAEEAFELGVFGYIVKPITEEKVTKQLSHMCELI